MSNSDDPGYWEEERQKALEAANQHGATAKDRKKAQDRVREAEQQLQRIGQARPSIPTVDESDEKPLAVEKD
jgi:hypothetical protein